MRRWAQRRDESEPAIVDALEKGGCLVYRELPSDLLIHRPAWGAGWFRVQEAKTPTATGKPRAHSQTRRKKQDAFMAATGVARVTTAEQALRDVGLTTERDFPPTQDER